MHSTAGVGNGSYAYVGMGAASASTAIGPQLPLDATCGSDEETFLRLVEPHLPQLQAHCYRMLGSLEDAEDALQDTLLRAWRGLGSFDHRRPSRPWLFKIATNACLNAMERRPRRVLPMGYGPPAATDVEEDDAAAVAVRWLEPYPDDELGLEADLASPEARYEQREALELAFLTVLQYLPGRQRAALILRDVLGFSAREVADVLETSTASANGALQRARKTVAARRIQPSQQTALRLLGERGIRELVTQFVNAFEGGDVKAIVDLLTENATFAMPPYVRWYRGRAAIADSWLMPGGQPAGLRYIPTRANGQLAFGVYALDPKSGSYLPIALDVLAIHRELITEIIAFRSPEIFPRFRLPEMLKA